MLVMIDDVQFKEKEIFYTFMSRSLGLGPDGITDENKLYDVISEFKEPLEIILNDMEDVPEENKKLARQALKIFMDCKLVNKNITVSFFDEEAASKDNDLYAGIDE